LKKGPLGGEVLALRSIAALNAALPTLQGKEARAEAFYLLGQSYLSSVFSEHTNLGEKYLESCIRTFPKTPWSKKCYQKYEKSCTQITLAPPAPLCQRTKKSACKNSYKLVE
jgi:hypothetical protein